MARGLLVEGKLTLMPLPPHGAVGVGSRRLGLPQTWLDIMVINRHGLSNRLWVLIRRGRLLIVDLGILSMVASPDEEFEEELLGTPCLGAGV